MNDSPQNKIFGIAARILRSNGAALICLVALVAGCAHHPSTTAPPPKKSQSTGSIIVPAGVDSGVAVQAAKASGQVLIGWKDDSVANELYKQGRALSEEGNTLRDAIRASQQKSPSAVPSDSLRSLTLLQQGDEAAIKGDQTLGRKKLTSFTPEQLAKSPEAARLKAAQYYEDARDLYEQSLALNPWNKDASDALLSIYKDLISLHSSLSDVDAELNNQIKYMDLYGESFGRLARIGQLWAEKGDTIQALMAYRRAEDALLIWSPLTISPAATGAATRSGIDSAQYKSWLTLIQYQCFFEVSLGLSGPALADLNRLKNSCRGETDSVLHNWAQHQLDWLLWDDGNLITAGQRTQIFTFWGRKQWREARESILNLIPQLSSSDAIFDMEYWAAMLDFGYLEQYDAGLTRMRRLLNSQGFVEANASLDSLLNDEGGDRFAERMTAQRKRASTKLAELLDYYGNACVDHGVRLEKQTRDRERAYVYYYQAALVPCRKQPEALSYLADLSRNQPDKAILYGETARALSRETPLDTESRIALYETLQESYRRKNDRAHTQFYYDALKTIRDGGGKP
jgi:hypothetical protein